LKNNYILIDYENVQPKTLTVLNGHPFKVFVFVGASQEKVSFELASSLQSLGDSAEYVKISGTGPNSLDFHIAFYIGQLAERDSNAYFHIISKDTGFDPLIKHLRSQKIFAQRQKDLAEIPLVRLCNTVSLEQKLAAIVKSLRARGQARPRTLKALGNTINAIFMKSLEKAELGELMRQLCEQGHIAVDHEDVTYGASISQP
jgi:PIN domain